MTFPRLAIALFLFSCLTLNAERQPYVEIVPVKMVMEPADSVQVHENNRLVPVLLSGANNKKLIAALLAFPFPFGIVGLHRIYLGCAPHVPVAYIATVGGGFGLLPFIDFWVLLLSKNTDQFVNNGQVFMWLK